jgi:hypothetical protein
MDNMEKAWKLLPQQNSIKCSQADSRIKIGRFSDVSRTDTIPIFRVLLVAW